MEIKQCPCGLYPSEFSLEFTKDASAIIATPNCCKHWPIVVPVDGRLIGQAAMQDGEPDLAEIIRSAWNSKLRGGMMDE